MADVSELGVTAAELMESLEAEYADKDDVELGVVAVIAEVNYRAEDDEVCVIEFRCSDGRRWIQYGLFRGAIRAVADSSEALEDD